MANEVINLNTVFSGFNSGTDLQPKNTRTNNQGVKVEDIAGFVKLGDKPDSTKGTKGDMVFNEVRKQLYVCITSFSSDPSVPAAWVESPVFVAV